MPINVPSDRLLKELAALFLKPSGQLETELEILAASKRVDLWYVPFRDKAVERKQLGALGRMADAPCLLEGFHNPPSVDTVLRCITKQQLWWERLQLNAARKARRVQRAAASDALSEIAPQTVLLPPQWIICGGVPKTAIETLEFRPMVGWPRGFYRAAEGLRVHIVATNELPETVDTLALRLMGTGSVLVRAIAEVNALRLESAVWDEWARALGDLVVSFRSETEAPTSIEAEFMMEAVKLVRELEQEALEKGKNLGVAEGKKLGVAEGKKLGVAEGRSEVLRDLIELRLGRALTASEATTLKTRVDTLDRTQLLKAIDGLDRSALEAWLVSSPSDAT